MKLKKIVLGVIALSIVATLTTGCGQKAELKNGEEVAVKVDGVKITADEYYNEIKTNNVAMDNNVVNMTICVTSSLKCNTSLF